MKKPQENKKVLLDPKNYSSNGAGVSTKALIRNAEANDEEWDGDMAARAAAAFKPKPLSLRFNLISQDSVKQTSEYVEKVSLEEILIPEIRNLQIFKNTELFKKFNANKDKIKKQLRAEAQTVYDRVQGRYDNIIIAAIDNQEFLTRDVTDIFIEQLRIKDSPASRKLMHSLAATFIDAFTDIED